MLHGAKLRESKSQYRHFWAQNGTCTYSAVFIARGIYGNPWVFGDARALALDGTPVPSRSSVERLDALREHLTLTHELLPLMSRARTYASWYLKGMPHAAAWRAQVVRCSTYEEFMALAN